MEAYQNLGTIGEGTYGIVLKCRHRETGQLVAIKQFKKTDEDKKVHKTVEREVRVLKLLRHGNIVSLLDSFKYRGRTCIVMEYVQQTVLECLKVHPHGLGTRLTKQVTWQLVKALEYMHTQKVPLLHRDIKPENILVSDQGMVKLCDFGFARPSACAGRGEPLSDYVATRWYRSPELLVGDPYYGPAIDVWAIGCMAVEMFTGEPLFPGDSDVDQLWLILKCMGQLPPAYADMLSRNEYFAGMRQPGSWEREPLERRFRHFDAYLLQFLKACLHIDPEQRLTCSELLTLPYLAGVEATIPATILHAQERAAEEREALSKLRKQKRKSADLETGSAARPVINLTASALASQPDAPRYHLHSTDHHLQASAAQSIASTAAQWQASQPDGSAQHALCTVSAQPQPAQQAGQGGAAPLGASELCLQLPLRARQQQQLQAHLQLHHRYQMDLAAGVLPNQALHGSSSAANGHGAGPLPGSWLQESACSHGQESSSGGHDSSATVTTEMEISPDKRQKAPKSTLPDAQLHVAARQQRFMAQMLGREGGPKPEPSLNVTTAAHKLSLAAVRPELIHLRPGKYMFNSSMMPTTPQAGGGIRAVYSFAPRQAPDGSASVNAPKQQGSPAESAAQHGSAQLPSKHHERSQLRHQGGLALAAEDCQAKPGEGSQGLQRTQSHPGLRRSQRKMLTQQHH